MNKTDIREILPLVPHRPPLVWVDEIVRFDATSGESVVIMKPDAYFWSAEGLRGSSCLEFIAQSYGYCSVAYTKQQNPAAPPLKKAFLASFKDATLAKPERIQQVKAGDRIHVRYSGVRNIGPITLFNGEVLHNDEVICASQLKVFCES